MILAVALLATAVTSAPPVRVGAEVVIDRATRGPVVAVLADIAVDAPVDGDVVALGGDVIIGRLGTIEGDVVALGGSVVGSGRVAGRSVAVGGDVDSLSRGSGHGVGSLLIRLGTWLIVAWVLLRVWPRTVSRTARQIGSQLPRVAVAGAMTILASLALFFVALAVASSPLGGAVVVLGIAGFMVAKAVGVVALALGAGRLLILVAPRLWVGQMTATCLAVGGFVLLSLLPVVGKPLWQVLGVTGIGAVAAALIEKARGRGPRVPLPR